jgi:hypothetical protein
MPPSLRWRLIRALTARQSQSKFGFYSLLKS